MVIHEASTSSAGVGRGAGPWKQQEKDNQPCHNSAPHPQFTRQKRRLWLKSDHQIDQTQQQEGQRTKPQNLKPEGLAPERPVKFPERSPVRGQTKLSCSKRCPVHCLGGSGTSSQKNEIQKLLKQNNEIIRLNTLRAIQYRKCENERLQLVSENLELRTKVAKIRESLLDEERKAKLMETIQLTRENTRWTLSYLISQLRHAATCIEEDVTMMANTLVYDEAVEVSSGGAGSIDNVIGSAKRMVKKQQDEHTLSVAVHSEFAAEADSRKRRGGDGVPQSQHLSEGDRQSKLEPILEEIYVVDAEVDSCCPRETVEVTADHHAHLPTCQRHLSTPPREVTETTIVSAQLLPPQAPTHLEFRGKDVPRDFEVSKAEMPSMPPSPESPPAKAAVVVDPGPVVKDSRRQSRRPLVNYALPSIRSKLRKGDSFTFTLPESTFATRAAAPVPDGRSCHSSNAISSDCNRQGRRCTPLDASSQS